MLRGWSAEKETYSKMQKKKKKKDNSKAEIKEGAGSSSDKTAGNRFSNLSTSEGSSCALNSGDQNKHLASGHRAEQLPRATPV